MSKDLKPGPETAKSGTSTALLIFGGCAAVTLIGVLACAGIVGFGVWYGVNAANEFSEEFESKGYERVTGQQLTETEAVKSKRVYVAQQLIIKDGSSDDLAIACQMAVIGGTVNGDIDFFGQVLEIKKDAVIKGDIRIQAGQVISIQGVVEGEVSGNYQVLDDKRKPTPP